VIRATNRLIERIYTGKIIFPKVKSAIDRIIRTLATTPNI